MFLNKIWFCIWVGILLFNNSVSAVIFDTDDRREVYTNTFVNKNISPSVAAMVSPVFLQENTLGFAMNFPLISDSSEIALCPEQRFSNQPTASVSCTGFLVGPDLLVTAGHCMTHQDTEVQNSVTPFCSDFKWVFDYKYGGHKNLNPVFEHDRIVGCKEVLYAKFNYKLSTRFKVFAASLFGTPDPNEVVIHGEDIALIRLNRPMNRPFLALNQKYKNLEPISMVGHPNGLPQKVTMNAKIKQTISEDYFATDLDAFEGNSGSPIFNSRHEVIGVLVRAFPDADYKYLKNRQCSIVNTCNSFTKKCSVEDPNKEVFAHGQILPDHIIKLINTNAPVSI